jgi:hypothetical protein
MDTANNLRLDFHDANGSHQVTVLENQGRLRVETIRNSYTNGFRSDRLAVLVR